MKWLWNQHCWHSQVNSNKGWSSGTAKMSWFIPRLLQQQTIPSRCCHFLDVVATNPKFSLRQSCHLPAGLPGPQEECYPAWVRHFTNIFQKCLKIYWTNILKSPRRMLPCLGDEKWESVVKQRVRNIAGYCGILWLDIRLNRAPRRVLPCLGEQY